MEDPAPWSAAWWVWSAGFASGVLGAAAVLPPRRRPVWWMLVVLGAVVPFYLLGLGVMAMLVSLFTSVQGATTAFAAGLVLPAIAAMSAWSRHAWSDRAAARQY